MLTTPLVSCLCITKNNVEQLKRSINCFLSQSYPNKQLIIVYESNSPSIDLFLNSNNNSSIKIVKINAEPKLSLGELRNISLSYAEGEYFCQWDADDWYHNDRIRLQMSSIVKLHKTCCFLSYWIMFDAITKKAYRSRKRLWEGSVVCKIDRVKNDSLKYPSLPKLEDFQFVEKLIANKGFYPLDIPNLYIYVYHGENTWDYRHFLANFKAGQELSTASSKIIEEILDGRYSNSEASDLMDSSAVLEQIDYAYEFY